MISVQLKYGYNKVETILSSAASEWIIFTTFYFKITGCDHIISNNYVIYTNQLLTPCWTS